MVTPSGRRLSDWRAREYGLGVIAYPMPEDYPPEGVAYSAPSKDADTVAFFGDGQLCLGQPPECRRLFDHLIEYDYEIASWAILDFSADSSWVEVSLDPYGGSEPAAGWIQMSAGREPLHWSELLPEQWLFFLWPDSLEFFNAPSHHRTVLLDLESEAGPDRYDYALRPLEDRGRWLKVEVMTPSPQCRGGDSISVRRDTVWIEYLAKTGRPRTFFYTRGC